jgi:D-glycero-D-manno-heptose 1,7-bisphosphate phosphatase
MYNRLMDAALFIDRDGVIIENRDEYVRSWSDVAIYPQALEALALAESSPYKIVVITNQAGIGKGLYSLETALEINERLKEVIQSYGGRVDGLYLCPHRPEDQCFCRKPKPGLLMQASHELSIDLSRSIMIGDALSDLQAGKAAGVRRTILVLTGRGSSQVALPEASQLKPFTVFANLKEVIQSLLGKQDIAINKPVF